jgi:hypothetical protein
MSEYTVFDIRMDFGEMSAEGKWIYLAHDHVQW